MSSGEGGQEQQGSTDDHTAGSYSEMLALSTTPAPAPAASASSSTTTAAHGVGSVETRSEPVRGLHTAAVDNDLRCVDALLRKGAFVDVRNRLGRTPLMGACYYGHRDIVELLLRHGASTEARCNDQATPLMYAALGAKVEIVQLLLAHGAERDTRAQHGRITTRQCAVAGRDPSVIRLVEGRDILGSLPTELALRVLSYLDVTSILAVSQTCRSWRQLANDTHLWRRLCEERHWLRPEIDQLMSYGINPHKVIFAERNTVRRNWRQNTCTTRTLYGHTQGVFGIASVCSNTAASIGDKSLRFWSLETGEQTGLVALEEYLPQQAQLSCILPVRMSVSPSTTTTTTKQPTESSQQEGSVAHSGSNSSLSASGLDDALIIADHRGQLRLFSLGGDLTPPTTASLQWTLQAHEEMVTAIASGPEAHQFYTSSFDSTVKLWDLTRIRPGNGGPATLATGAPSAVFRGHLGDIHAICSREQVLASGSFDRTVRLWDPRIAENGSCTGVIRGLGNSVTDIKFLDDRTLVIFDLDRNMSLADVRTARITGACVLETWARTSCFNDGILAVGLSNGAVLIYDGYELARSGPSVAQPGPAFFDHRNSMITALCIQDDKLISASRHGTLVVRDYSAPRELLKAVDRRPKGLSVFGIAP